MSLLPADAVSDELGPHMIGGGKNRSVVLKRLKPGGLTGVLFDHRDRVEPTAAAHVIVGEAL